MLKELFYPTDVSLLFISSFFFYLTNHLLLSVKKHQITFLQPTNTQSDSQ